MGEREERLEKLEELRNLGIDPYPTVYQPKSLAKNLKKAFEERPEAVITVDIAGRIVLKRLFGKALFMTLEDESDTIQIYAQQQTLNERYTILKKLIDLGDILGVRGTLFRTQKGEITVAVTDFTVLSKAINPFPDKYHGITDKETRYRQRYADMIVNRQVREDFILRSRAIQVIRDTLYKKDFLEVETPILQPIPGGANARPFVTHHNALDMEFYLRIATELYLKRVIIGGIPRVFELGRIFRNEGVSYKHNPEFTSVEVYEAFGDNQSMMTLTEEIFTAVLQETKGSLQLSYQEKMFDFTPPYRRLSMIDALKEIAGIDVETLPDIEKLRAEALKKGASADKLQAKTYYSLIYEIFEELVEEKLHGPVFILDHPHELSPLAKQKAGHPELADRFELFIDGKEFANAFSEQNDPNIQKAQFQEQLKAKDSGDHDAMFYDADFINALEYGMPPTGGLGIGIDRLCMLLIDTPTIRDTLIFPHMRPDHGSSTNL